MSDNKYVSYLRSGVHRHVDNHKCADYIEQLQGEAKENEQQILGDMKRIRQLQAALKSIRDDKRVGWVDRFRVTASKALAPPKEETDE